MSAGALVPRAVGWQHTMRRPIPQTPQPKLALHIARWACALDKIGHRWTIVCHDITSFSPIKDKRFFVNERKENI